MVTKRSSYRLFCHLTADPSSDDAASIRRNRGAGALRIGDSSVTFLVGALTFLVG